MKDYNIMESQSHRFSEVYFHFLFIKNQENRMNGSRNPIALVRSISTARNGIRAQYLGR